jgi:CxxC motif-containing protein
MELMELVDKIELEERPAIGDVIVKDVLGLGVDLKVTKR